MEGRLRQGGRVVAGSGVTSREPPGSGRGSRTGGAGASFLTPAPKGGWPTGVGCEAVSARALLAFAWKGRCLWLPQRNHTWLGGRRLFVHLCGHAGQRANGPESLAKLEVTPLPVTTPAGPGLLYERNRVQV